MEHSLVKPHISMKMESKVIVLAVLVLSGHNFFISSFKGVNGLSAEVSAGLYRLRATQELATSTTIKAHYSVTSILTKLASKYIYSIDCEGKLGKSAITPLVTSLGRLTGIDITPNKPINGKPTSVLDHITGLLSSIGEAIKTDDIITAAKTLPKLESIPSIDNSTAALLAEGCRLDKLAFDYIVDEIPFAVGRCCNDLERTKVTLHAYFDVIWLVIALAIDLTVVGVYPENQAVIGTIQSALPIIVTGFIGQIYNLFRTCSNTTDPDMLKLINAEEKRSADYFYLAGVALLNECRWLINAVATGNKSPVLISNIEECGDKMNWALRDLMNHEALTSEVFYVKRNLRDTEQVTVSDLAANQFVMIVRIAHSTEAVDSSFDEVFYQIDRKKSGIIFDGTLDFSRSDNARAKLADYLVDSLDPFLSLILSLHPHSSSGVTEARKTLIDLYRRISNVYINMITLASDKSKTASNVTDGISGLKNKAIELSRKPVDVYFSLLRNGQQSSDNKKTELTSFYNAAISTVGNYVESFANAVKILAKVLLKDDFNSIDYETAIKDVRTARKLVISEVYKLLDAIYQASLVCFIKK